MMTQPAVQRPRVREHFLSSPSELAQRVTQLAEESLRRALALRGRASLVLSGGRTAAVVLPCLGGVELEWDRVTLSLADDRWVPPESNDSNERLVRTKLMTGPARDARMLSMYKPGLTVKQACAEQERTFPPALMPFDAVLLGMGEDGHFASVFPSSDPKVIACTDSRLFVPGTAPKPPAERISMAPRALLNSRRIILAIQGEDKRALYRRVLLDSTPSNLPVRTLLHRRSAAEIHVVWSAW